MIYRDPITLQLVHDPERKGFHKRTFAGVMKVPGRIYQSFVKSEAHPQVTWLQNNESARKRRRINKIARLSRRRNRR